MFHLKRPAYSVLHILSNNNALIGGLSSGNVSSTLPSLAFSPKSSVTFLIGDSDIQFAVEGLVLDCCYDARVMFHKLGP
jgi:hypothetical protein